MNNNHIAETMELLNDGETHEFYELNQKYRLTLTQSKKTIETLRKEGIVECQDNFFVLKKTLSRAQIVYLYKTLRKRAINLESEVIDSYCNESIGIDEVYLPNFDRLSGELTVDE